MWSVMAAGCIVYPLIVLILVARGICSQCGMVSLVYCQGVVVCSRVVAHPSVHSFQLLSGPLLCVTVWNLAYTANSVGIWPVWDFGWASVNSGLQHGPSFSSAML